MTTERTLLASAQDTNGTRYSLLFLRESDGVGVVCRDGEKEEEVFRTSAGSPVEALAELEAKLPSLGLKVVQVVWRPGDA